MVSFLPLPAAVLNGRGVIREANQLLAGLTGLSLEDLPGLSFSRLLPPHQRRKFREVVENLKASNGSEIVLATRTGEIPVQVWFSPLPQRGRKLFLFRDLTQEKRENEQLKIYARDLHSLYKGVKEQLREKEALLRTTEILVSSLELSTVLKKLLSQVASLMDGLMAVAFALPTAPGRFTVAAWKNRGGRPFTRDGDSYP